MNYVEASKTSDPHGPDFVECTEPVALIPSKIKVNEKYDKSIILDTIHDGHIIPLEFSSLRAAYEKNSDLRSIIDSGYINERDWGAHWVAHYLSKELGLRGYYRVVIARALVDYGRFPGISEADSGHLSRLAINPPFSEIMSDKDKEIALDYYDKIADRMADTARERLSKRATADPNLIKIAIHTYDEWNPSGTRRPVSSVLTRPESVQQNMVLLPGIFDNLFPSQLAEFTADRVLTYRIGLTFEKAYLPTGIEFPYTLPEGSVELRSQVWFFFQHLKEKFESDSKNKNFIKLVEKNVYNAIWKMLTNTNSRALDSISLRAYLEKYCNVPNSQLQFFKEARKIYNEIKVFIQENYEKIVRQYQYSTSRPSSLIVEVRKDYLCEGSWIGKKYFPRSIKDENARRIAHLLSNAIKTYIEQDIKDKTLARKRLPF